MSLDATGVKNESDVRGRQLPEPGTYHGIVQHVDDSQDQHDAIIVELEVLAGDTDGQRGRTLRHMMFLNDEGQYTDRHLRFALAVGLIRPGEAKEPDWKEAEGRQLVFAVEKRAGKKKDGTAAEFTNVANYGLDLWGVNNPEVADVPKDQKALAIMQGGAPAGAAGAQAGAAPAAADDPYANI